LILTKRQEHAKLINQMLMDKEIHSVILTGAMQTGYIASLPIKIK